MKKFIKGFLISLIPAVVFTIGILIVSTSDTPQVKRVAEIIRPGYQTEPARYVVEASYAKYWKDSRSVILIILAYLIVIGGTTLIIYEINEKEISSKAGNVVLTIAWLISALLIFIPMAFKYGSSSYQSTLTEQQYEDNRNNLDNLFPMIERETK